MEGSLIESREIEEGENQADDAFTDANDLNSRAAFWRVFHNSVKKPKSYIIKILDRRPRRS
jgi:uncharacterized protein (DUF2126 family)